MLLNVSHHVDQVRAFLSGVGSRPHVTLSIEKVPLGSAGTLAANRGFVESEDEFLIAYTDNLTTLALAPLLETHRRHDDALTMVLFRAPEPRRAGIVTLDPGGRVVAFAEKPDRPVGDLANAGVYLARPSVFEAIPSRPTPVDLAHHVLPRLVGKMHGHVTSDFLMDIGTPAALRRACELWPMVRRRRLG